MTISRALGTLTVGLVLLTGCGGDGDVTTDPGQAPTTAAPSGPGAGATLDGENNCDVDVAVSGDLEKAWTGTGSSTTSTGDGPPAFYQAAADNVVISVYSGGNGFKPSVVVTTAEDQTYQTRDGATGLKIASDGSAVTIDSDAGLAGQGGGIAHVIASFTC